jgi:aspartate racemase
MKTIGLLGGMSWESTVNYYQAINQEVKHALGGLHSAKICLVSVDFAEIEKLQQLGQWQQAAELLAKSAQAVEAGGADFLLICTNTMHKVAPQISAAISIPLLHIADTTAEHLRSEGRQKVGLLGTRFTMEQDFYRQRISDNFGIEVIIPNTAQRQFIHQVIYEELCLGKLLPSSRQQFVDIILALQQQGAQGVILGCTEIAMLVQQDHCAVPLYDTTHIHAMAAVKHALS